MAEPIPVYRFLDLCGALKTLEAGKFRVGLISKFNDPFEWRLGVIGTTTAEEKQVSDKINSDHRTWFEKGIGILCFSDSFADPVLWSLYAEKHRGVAFEVRYPWPDDNLQKMTYFKERPVLDFNRWREMGPDVNIRNQYLLTLLNGLMTNKSPGFAFEREYRLHIDLKDNSRCEFNNGNYDWSLPEKSLKRVILGFCCPLKEMEVRKLLDMKGFTETEVVRAKMSQETYSIVV